MNNIILIKERRAAEILGFSYSYLKSLRHKRGIRFVRVGKAIRYKLSDLHEFISERLVEISSS
jgi:excisionase family DNA binding protein